jgi:type II secretory pathway pseudopilin PulG
VQLLLAAALVGAAIAAAGWTIAARIAAARERAEADAARARRAQLLALFAPGIAASAADARALLTWQPLAATARALFPDDFAALDRAAGRPFPFSLDDLQAAHARWSADWLAWERIHDTEFKLKAAAVEEELHRSGGSAVVRARLDRVEGEKLEQYQRRYEEYTRVSKGLKALTERQVH